MAGQSVSSTWCLLGWVGGKTLAQDSDQVLRALLAQVGGGAPLVRTCQKYQEIRAATSTHQEAKNRPTLGGGERLGRGPHRWPGPAAPAMWVAWSG